MLKKSEKVEKKVLIFEKVKKVLIKFKKVKK